VEEKIDITISNICDWLNERLINGCVNEDILSKMISALAELVEARADMY
jgi:hypothetical protein